MKIASSKTISGFFSKQNKKSMENGMMKKIISVMSIAILFVGTATFTHGSIIEVTGAGFTYTQDFDSLNDLPIAGTQHGVDYSDWENGSTLNGWYSAGHDQAERIRRGDGSTNTYEYLGHMGVEGENPVTDRALAVQPSSGQTPIMAVYFRNTSGGDLTQGFSLGYTAEQWRRVSNDPALTMEVQYQVFANGTADLSAASEWTTLSDLEYTSAAGTGDSTAMDGNHPDNRQVFDPLSVTGFTWADNEELVIRWIAAPGGQDRRHRIAIDDVSFTAIPEPGTLVLLGLAGLLLLKRRRV